MENVVFTYQRNKEDVLKQQLWQTYKRNKLMFILNIIFPISGVYFLIDNIVSETDSFMYALAVYLILYPVINYFLIKMRINSYFKNPTVAFDKTTFDYSRIGINLSSEKGDLLLEWDKLYKVYDTKEYIYVYVDRRSSVMVRKDILSEHQVEFILKLIKDSTLAGVCNY